MRIGIDARFYGSIGKGLGRYTEKLIMHLEEIDSENEYVIFLRRENFREYVPRHSNFQKVLADYPWYGWQEQILFPALLRSYRFDLMHFPHFNVPLLYGRKFVVTIHDLILFHFPTVQNTTIGWLGYIMKYSVYRFVISLAIRRAQAILTVSHFTKEDIGRYYPAAKRKIFVTMEAADDRCFFVPREELDTILDRYGLLLSAQYDRMKGYFLYVGNAYPHKNLEAIVYLARKFPEQHFVFVGKQDFFYRRLMRLASDIPNISFFGFVPDRELSVLYRHAIAYLFPSRYEGFGLPGLEAMQHGLPVISSDQGSLPEIYGSAAIFFHPDTQGGLEHAVRGMLNHEDLRARLRRMGFDQSGKFHWIDMAHQTLSVYRESMGHQKETH